MLSAGTAFDAATFAAFDQVSVESGSSHVSRVVPVAESPAAIRGDADHPTSASLARSYTYCVSGGGGPPVVVRCCHAERSSGSAHREPSVSTYTIRLRLVSRSLRHAVIFFASGAVPLSQSGPPLTCASTIAVAGGESARV